MRKKRDYSRKIEQDILYNSVSIERFINYIMKNGKKSLARKIVYKALDDASKKLKKDSIEIFDKAIENVSPVFEVVSKRIGGANYQVPREVRPRRKFFLACKWIINAANSIKGKNFYEKLSIEIVNAFNNEGEAIKKKENMHRMAEANRAFAHFAK